MRYSLQSREIIADSIETVTCAQRHDANISIPGCDKNMPGVVMAAARHNRPFVMIYGGTIRRGHSKLLDKTVNISDVSKAPPLSLPPVFEMDLARNTCKPIISKAAR